MIRETIALVLAGEVLKQARPDSGDAALASALAAGEADALADLYDRYGALAYGLALRILSDQGHAEDVVQDAFLSVWQRAGTFNAARGSLRGWLLAAVRHRAIDEVRGRRGRERRELDLPEAAASSGAGSDVWREVSRSLERQVIQEALNSLPDEQRQTIELAFYGGYSYSEIARMTRAPLGTVKGRARLGLEKLHSFLAGQGVLKDS